MDKNKNKSIFKKNIILLVLILLIGVVPLLLVKSEFGGSDDKGEEMIKTIKPDYKPWAKNLIELPGEETESLLFALQAALGAGIVGYEMCIRDRYTKSYCKQNEHIQKSYLSIIPDLYLDKFCI